MTFTRLLKIIPVSFPGTGLLFIGAFWTVWRGLKAKKNLAVAIEATALNQNGLRACFAEFAKDQDEKGVAGMILIALPTGGA